MGMEARSSYGDEAKRPGPQMVRIGVSNLGSAEVDYLWCPPVVAKANRIVLRLEGSAR